MYLTNEFLSLLKLGWELVTLLHLGFFSEASRKAIDSVYM